jgi:hypothetical protein
MVRRESPSGSAVQLLISGARRNAVASGREPAAKGLKNCWTALRLGLRPQRVPASTARPTLQVWVKYALTPRGFAERAKSPAHAPSVSSFAFLECFALTEDTVGLFWVWIGIRAVAAVSSVQRLRMSANAKFITDHVSLAPSVRGQGYSASGFSA